MPTPASGSSDDRAGDAPAQENRKRERESPDPELELEDGEDANEPKRARTSDSSPITYTVPPPNPNPSILDFAGNVTIQSDRTQSSLDAKCAEMFKSCPEHIELSLFCDGSKITDPIRSSGYSVVFKLFRPGHPDDGKEVVMGWQVTCGALQDCHFMEAMGLLQAIRLAESEIRTILKHLPAGSMPTTIKAKIHSDSQGVLQPIQNGVYPRIKKTFQVMLRRLLREIRDDSHRLRNCTGDPSTLVDTGLHWLKGHSGGVRSHALADNAAGKAARVGTYATIDGQLMPPFPCVLDQALLDDLVQIHTSPRLPRRESQPVSSTGTPRMTRSRAAAAAQRATAGQHESRPVTSTPRMTRSRAAAQRENAAASSLTAVLPLHPRPVSVAVAPTHTNPTVVSTAIGSEESTSTEFNLAREVYRRGKDRGHIFDRSIFIVDATGETTPVSVAEVKKSVLLSTD